MFGRRAGDIAKGAAQGIDVSAVTLVPAVVNPGALAATPVPRAPEPVPDQRRHSNEYYDVKTTVFNALIDSIDLTQLAKLDSSAARDEIRGIVTDRKSVV